MGKTLRNIVLGFTAALAITSAFVVGKAIGKVNEELKNTNTNYVSDSASKKLESKAVKNNLENYLLTGDETNSINTISTQIYNKSELHVPQSNQINSNSNSEKIFKAGIGNYVMPPIEADSGAKNLTLKIFEFESAKDVEDFVKLSEEVTQSYPLITQDNVAAIIEPTIKDSESLSPKQKELYDSIISNYVNKRGANAILSKDAAEQEELAKTLGITPNNPYSNNTENNNKGIDVSNFSNFDSSSGNAAAQKDDIATRQARNTINQIANAITEVNSRKDNSMNNLERKTVEVGIRVIPDIFNAEVVFYEREGKCVSRNDVYTSDWKEYGREKENGRGFGVTETFFAALDKDSFVEIKAIVNDPLYPSSTVEPFETRTYREDWERGSRVELVPVAMYHPNKK